MGQIIEAGCAGDNSALGEGKPVVEIARYFPDNPVTSVSAISWYNDAGEYSSLRRSGRECQPNDEKENSHEPDIPRFKSRRIYI